MADVVFIVGAGASREAGAPLMNDFLDVAMDLWRRGEVGDSAEHFERVFKGVGHLQQVHSKAMLDIHNLEAVFSAFEMARALGGFGEYGPEETEALCSSMNRVIVSTLELSMKFPIRQGEIEPPKSYKRFGQILKSALASNVPHQSIALLTFNYDLALDQTLSFHAMPYSYCLFNRDDGELPLLKLHGSINWGVAKSGGGVVPWEILDYTTQTRSVHRAQFKELSLHPGSQMAHRRNVEGGCEPEPLIVPPTWNKGVGRQDLQRVWARAANELSEASAVVVIGYSLPETDLFFRYLYALGSLGKNPLKKFLVINPDSSGNTEARFSGLLGPGARDRFSYLAATFEGGLDAVQGTFSYS